MSRCHRLFVLIFCSLLVNQATGQENSPLPEGPNVNLVYAKCQHCHPISYTTESAGLPDFLWADTLSLMKQLGMMVTEEEEQKLYEYLITYLGVNPPPKPAGDSEIVAQVDGASVYAGACAACHGPEGQGTSDAFPPLAGHAIALATADRSYPPLVVIYGLSGKIDVAGKRFDGVMPPWGHLSNEEIAAVLNLVTGWKADGGSTPAPEGYTVSGIEQSRGLGLTGSQVRERRPSPLQ